MAFYLRASCLIAMTACGPAIDTPADTEADASTGTPGSSSSSSSNGSTSSTTVPSNPTTTPSTSTVSATESTGDVSSSGEDESSTTGGCSCEGSPIGIEDESDDGFPPSELLAATVFAGVDWEWGALALDPTTTGSGGGTYRGGAIIDEVGGCCGSFLCGPCGSGVTFEELRFVITTADGRLDHAFTGLLNGPREYEEDVLFESDPIPFGSLDGTLSTEAFDDAGTPFFPETVFVVLEWSYDTEMVLEHIALWGEDGVSQVRLGHYDAP